MPKRKIEKPRIDLSKEACELRNFLIKDLYSRIDVIHRTYDFTDKYLIQIKSWCISLFMVSTGFSLKEDNYYYLPLIPVILFWFLHAYRQYRLEQTKNHRDLDIISNYLQNIYEYPIAILQELVKDAKNLKFEWEDKGKLKPRRFIRSKILGILKNAIYNLENLFLFGGMLFFWMLINWNHLKWLIRIEVVIWLINFYMCLLGK